MPGPGAYKPRFTQQDKKSDRVSHALQTLDKRFTYFDQAFSVQKGKNEEEFNGELGCCDRVMRNLQHAHQMTELNQKDMKLEEGDAMAAFLNTMQMKSSMTEEDMHVFQQKML